MTLLATLQWRPQLNPLLCGLLVLALGAWLYWTYRRLLVRFPRGKALGLLSPKLLVMTLLVLALFEPMWSIEHRESLKGKLLAVVDDSSSMDVADDDAQSRRARAEKILARLKDEVPGDVTVETLQFDTQLHKPAATPLTNGVRGTDLGGCLVALAERADISSCLGVMLFTDGGDERLQAATYPPVPLTIVGIGTDPTNWNDLAIADLEVPATVEKETQFEVSADLIARGTTARPVTVTLQRDGKPLASQTVDLSRHRARVKFPVTCLDAGMQRFRLAVERLPGELSYLNNDRVFTVDVQKKALHVLYFTRELGMDFKMLRSEIGRDPGIAFTALFRTLSERFTVQGDRLAGDEPLDAGFPTGVKTLQLFDCVIIGSFAASDWSQEQFDALVKYVEAGGAVIFLGGEKSFGLGGYESTPVAPLFPWKLEAGEPELARGTFRVNIPAAGAGHPIVAGLEDVLSQGATLASANQPGALKPGATGLLAVNVNNRNVPVVAVQSFGKGKVLGIASNTLWEWARKTEPLRNAYGVFWRQAVRNVTGKTEGGRYLSVRWDKDHYQPGEQATADIRLTGLTSPASVRLSATLQNQPLPVDAAKGQVNTFGAQCRFKERGEYVFRLVAYQGESVLETYEKTLPVAPLLAEGSRLELDDEPLKKLAEKTGGTYLRERDADQLSKTLAARFWQKTTVVEKPLTQAGPHFAGLVLALLVIEWWLRRKANLI